MAAETLFHVSEEPDIALFEPRAVGSWDSRIGGLAVWAVDAEHLPGYLLPRDCPRVTYACDSTTTAADRERFFSVSAARRIIAIEPGWIERAISSPIFIYDMPSETFEALDPHSGHFISRVAVKPLHVRAISNPMTEMLKHDVELRIVKDLLLLHDAVAHSTLSFSSTRLRNAAR